MSLTRNDLADEIERKLGLSSVQSRLAVHVVLDALTDALKSGQKVEFRGFGVFKVRIRKQKLGRNPMKPDEGTYVIMPKRVVKFSMGKDLDIVLNG